MSRRNTYLLGGLAVVAGIAMVVVAIVALTSGGDESTPSSDRNAPERPITPSPSPPKGADDAAAGAGPVEDGDRRGRDLIDYVLERRLQRLEFRGVFRRGGAGDLPFGGVGRGNGERNGEDQEQGNGSTGAHSAGSQYGWNA